MKRQEQTIGDFERNNVTGSLVDPDGSLGLAGSWVAEKWDAEAREIVASASAAPRAEPVAWSRPPRLTRSRDRGTPPDRAVAAFDYLVAEMERAGVPLDFLDGGHVHVRPRDGREG